MIVLARKDKGRYEGLSSLRKLNWKLSYFVKISELILAIAFLLKHSLCFQARRYRGAPDFSKSLIVWYTKDFTLSW